VEPIDYVSALRRELAEFGACLTGDLAAPVEHCGDWDLYDLADHLGWGNLWSAAAVTERRGDFDPPPAPRGRDALTDWYRGTCEHLLAALDTDPEAPAWTLAPPRTVSFWQRRRCMETLIHRWDAQHALGTPGPLAPALAADGVAEVFDTMAPRQVRLGRASEPARAVAFTAADAGTTWTWGSGEPVAMLSATAANLLLLLWGRLAPSDEAITREGDVAAVQAVLAGALVP